ncbi:MAG: agmatine deiminase family protein [Porphyromonas sp.]|nr:agmatine deiminase family protein [Porphyromonas sp.]
MRRNYLINTKPARLIAEWERQDAVLLVWPTEWMDWRDNLEEAVACYTSVAKTLLKYVRVIIVTDKRERVWEHLEGEYDHELIIVPDFYQNDTWVRDYGPLSIEYKEGGGALLDFGFNAWGLQFAANNDNRFCYNLFAHTDLFQDIEPSYRSERDYILEGGAIESNGSDVILSTTSVLCEPNRNPLRSESEHLSEIAARIGNKRVYSLDIEAMEGDDTHGHIDTIARFVDPHTILYNYTADERDVHYGRLRQLRAELIELQERVPSIEKLVPLPLPNPIFNSYGDQLPATYANFLMTNDAVIVPIYGDPVMDEVALGIIADHCPGRVVEGVDCRALIEQGGSLHCATMQLPQGYVNPKYFYLNNI